MTAFGSEAPCRMSTFVLVFLIMTAMATAYPTVKKLKTFRQQPRMLRGQQVDTASYQVEFEPRGSCKLLRACDPPWEVAFPKGPLGVSMAVEAIKASRIQHISTICHSSIMFKPF